MRHTPLTAMISVRIAVVVRGTITFLRMNILNNTAAAKLAHTRWRTIIRPSEWPPIGGVAR